MYKLLLPIIAVIVIAGGIFYFFNFRTVQPQKTLPTYFTYTQEEIKDLKTLTSTKTMTLTELQSLSNKVSAVAVKNKIGKTSLSTIEPYLTVAQRDAVFLSYNTNQKFNGTLGPVTIDVICMFEPEECKKITVDTDNYSSKLASIVMTKIKTRYEQSKKTTRYEAKSGKQYFSGTPKEPFKGIDLPTLTWLIKPVQSFRVPPPTIEYGSAEDKAQLQKAIDTVKNVTPEQKQIIEEIQALRAKYSVYLLWPDLADQAMKARKFDLAQTIFVRSIMHMTYADIIIAYNDGKYTYLVKRPYQKMQEANPNDPNLKLFEVSTNPGYPSGTALLTGAYGVIFDYLFPDKKDEMKTLNINMTQNEVWQGDHFALDGEISSKGGEKIGQEIIRQFKELGGLPAVATGK